MKSVLYLTRNGLLEPLGQSQIFSYLRGLSIDYKIVLITFEKPADWSNIEAVAKFKDLCLLHGIHWVPLRFRAQPRPFAAPLAIAQLAVAALWQWRHHSKPDLVHARSYVPAAIALLLHIVTRVPFIFDMRALWPEELITAKQLRRGSYLHRGLIWLERRCLKEASAVVSLTEAAISYLQSEYPIEVASQRLVVIPTCADMQRFKPAPTNSAGPMVIGCIGTVLSGWFKFQWLKAFFEALHRADPYARFEIISRDNPSDIRAALLPWAPWQDRLHIEAAPPDQMPIILLRHTVSVMFYAGGSTSELGRSPTRMAEVLGSGKPVVANSGVGDVGLVLSTHRVGVLASSPEPAAMDACVSELQLLLADPGLAVRCRLVANDLFSLEAGTAAYRLLYTQILA